MKRSTIYTLISILTVVITVVSFIFGYHFFLLFLFLPLPAIFSGNDDNEE